MNTMEDDTLNVYSARRDDDNDLPRSSTHSKKSKKKSSSSRSSRRRDDEFSQDEMEFKTSKDTEGNDDDERREKKRKKKSKHRDGNDESLSSGPPSEHKHRSSRKSDEERKSSRSKRHGDDYSEQKSTSKSREPDDDIRKPRAKSDRSSRSKSRRSDDDGTERKSKSRSHRSEQDASSRASSRASTMGAELESQMASKRRPTGPRPTRPGAVSSTDTPASNLSQFEQDVRAKNRARRSTKPATAPGVVQEYSSSRENPNAVAALSRLEQDAVAKSRASRTPAVAAGAVASTGGSQYGKASGRTSRASASRSNAAAVAAGGKTTGLDDMDDAKPAATSQRESLLEFENDLAAKNRTSSRQSTVIEPGGRRRARTNAIAVAGGTAAVATASSDMEQLENEVLSKPRQSSRSMENDAEEEPLVVDASEPQDDDYMDSFAVNEPFSQYAPASTNAGSGNRGSLLAAQVQNTSTSGVGTSLSEQPAEVYPGVDYASQDFANEGAVEAFVADNVVDAMGVAVVMSEEEEIQIERRKYKKYMILALICMVLIAIAIVVPVVLVVGNVEPAAPSAAPSMAPSMAPSSAPTSGRLADAIESLIPISGEEAFNDKSSPQYQAALWVSDDDPLALPIGDPQFEQRYILAVFYFSTNGDEWLHCGRLDPICGGDPDEDSWLSESSECVWLGLRCTDNVNVDRIFFMRTFGNNLDGTLPQELTFLSSLESMILQNNFIRGTIPEWLGDISLLNTLIMSGNPMEGTISPMMLLKSELLGTIHLSRGSLNGTIPSEFASLPITDLRLDENDFDGAIPTELGSIASLRILELQFNQLSEVLPLSLFNLENLVTLRVNDNNMLLGTIPATVAQMTNLAEIWMNATTVGGTLPESLYTLPKLTNLNLGGADFSGTLSEGVGALSELRFLKIQDNGFSGPLPVSLNNMTRLNDLLLHGNDLVGTISSALCARKGTNFFDLQNLTADCAGSPPQVFCPEDCCNVCLEGR